MVRLKRFQTLLKEKKDEFKGESDRVAIAEAGTQFSKNVQIKVDEQFSKENNSGNIKFDKVSSAVKNIPEQLRGDIENLEDGSYNDLVRFIRKYERLLNEVQGGRLYDSKEQEYIKKTVEPVLLEITNLKGPIARAAFAFEDFKSQFKPLKLADRFLGDLPIVGDMIRERLQAKNEADRLAKSTGLRAAKERTRGELKEAAETRKGISQPESSNSYSDDTSSGSVGSKAGNLAKNLFMGKGSEESQKEQANVKQRELNIFESIMQNTERTNELLEDLTEATEEGDGGGNGILQALGIQQLLKGGKGMIGKAAGGAASLLGLNKFKNMFGKNKNMEQNNQKNQKKNKKSMKKGFGKTAGKFGKAALRGFKFIPGIGLVAAGGMGLYDGVKGFNADEDASFGEKLGNAGSSVLSGLTFGLLGQSADEIAAESELSDSDISKALDTPNATARKQSQNVGLDQVFQINAEKVMLKANSMKQLQNENELIKRDMTTGQNGAVNNSVTSQVINNAKSTFMGPRLTSTNPRNIVKSVF
jgi:hypothetical protein